MAGALKPAQIVRGFSHFVRKIRASLFDGIRQNLSAFLCALAIDTIRERRAASA
jgi:hypothetical protein